MDYYVFSLFVKNVEIIVQVEDNGRVLMYNNETGELYFDSKDGYCKIPELKEVYETISLISSVGLRILSATKDKNYVYNVE